MTKKEQEWKEEQQHFEKCRSLIRENLMQYKGNLKKLQQEVKELYQMIRKGDLELYDQLMTASSMEENAHNQVRKHKAALARPYFGRIDYTDETAGTQERNLYRKKWYPKGQNRCADCRLESPDFQRLL